MPIKSELKLNVEFMDATHGEFEEILESMKKCEGNAEFMTNANTWMNTQICLGR